MINYTTPTIVLTVEGVDLTGMDVYVTLEQGAHELTKTGEDLTITIETESEQTNTVLATVLTQAESAAFDFGKSALVQVNWISAQGVRCATEIGKIAVMRNLLDEVVEYGG